MVKKIPLKILTFITTLASVFGPLAAVPSAAAMISWNGSEYFTVDELTEAQFELIDLSISECEEGVPSNCALERFEEHLASDYEFVRSATSLRFEITSINPYERTLEIYYGRYNPYSLVSGDEYDIMDIFELYVALVDPSIVPEDDYDTQINFGDDENPNYEPYFVHYLKETGKVEEGVDFLVSLLPTPDYDPIIEPYQYVALDLSNAAEKIERGSKIKVFYKPGRTGGSLSNLELYNCYNTGYQYGMGCQLLFNEDGRYVGYVATGEPLPEDDVPAISTPENNPLPSGSTETSDGGSTKTINITDNSLATNDNSIINSNDNRIITRDQSVTNTTTTTSGDTVTNNYTTTTNYTTTNRTINTTTNHTTTNTTDSHSTAYNSTTTNSSDGATEGNTMSSQDDVAVPVAGGTQIDASFVWWFIAFAGVSTLSNVALAIVSLKKH